MTGPTGCTVCGTQDTATVDGVCGRRCAAHPPGYLPDVALAQVDRGDSRGAFAYLRAALVQRLRVRS